MQIDLSNAQEELFSRFTMEESEEQPFTVLLADPDQPMRQALAARLRREGFRVIETGEPTEFIDFLSRVVLESEGEHVDIVIADIAMPGISTFESLDGIHGHIAVPTLICLSPNKDQETLATARNYGAMSVLTKPLDFSQVLAMCEFALMS